MTFTPNQMTLEFALDTVIDLASRYGENAEEGFSRRLQAEDTDEDTINACTEPTDDYEREQALEIRNLWRAIHFLHDWQKSQLHIIKD